VREVERQFREPLTPGEALLHIPPRVDGPVRPVRIAAPATPEAPSIRPISALHKNYWRDVRRLDDVFHASCIGTTLRRQQSRRNLGTTWHGCYKVGYLSQTTVRRGAILLVLLGAAAVGLREIVNSSTYQLFGDYVARVDTEERVVALTFDDGPDPTNTPKVLAVLDQQQVKATFFMMGRNVERYPAVAREVLRRGHEIGNHSYSHPKLVLMSPQRVRDVIERTDKLLRDIGVSGEILFRPPHAAKFIVLPCVLVQMKKLSVLGDVDPKEWKQRSAAVMTDSILRQVRPGSIIGLHDPNGAETLRTLQNILPALAAQGYRFETVSALVRRRAQS
jgi:peptidoglycan/xylan/chitin deacetylase (PgdA/CDA1 family)